MKNIILILLLSSVLNACKMFGPAPEKEGTPIKGNFYPISSYFENEWRYLDSMPLAVILYSTLNGVKDSTILEKAAFNQEVVQRFRESDVSLSELKKHYEETVFLDESINRITMTYLLKGKDLPVKKVDIYVDPQSEVVKSIYIERVEKDGTQKKMIWNTRRSCQIISLTEKPGEQPQTSILQYVWDK
jgi:hypothetical protein